jgi:hypothetical protein
MHQWWVLLPDHRWGVTGDLFLDRGGGNPGGSGVVQACPAGGADGGAAAVVFVVGGGVAQGLVQAHGVVVHATQVRFLFQLARVGDLVQVWVLAFEVAEERLDPGLVVRGGGPPESGWRCGARAINALVEREVICGPLSDRASSTGSSS